MERARLPIIVDPNPKLDYKPFINPLVNGGQCARRIGLAQGHPRCSVLWAQGWDDLCRGILVVQCYGLRVGMRRCYKHVNMRKETSRKGQIGCVQTPMSLPWKMLISLISFSGSLPNH